MASSIDRATQVECSAQNRFSTANRIPNSLHGLRQCDKRLIGCLSEFRVNNFMIHSLRVTVIVVRELRCSTGCIQPPDICGLRSIRTDAWTQSFGNATAAQTTKFHIPPHIPTAGVLVVQRNVQKH